ncbi:MAG: serine/threonine-protein kinase, partial [archaeon]|nr:serine/threonine-protein kinase [archaeon]
GSPDYAAPELYLGKPYRGTEVDVWAMGVVLFAMITGEFPFPGADSSQIAFAVCRRDYNVPFGVSPALLDLLARMLTKDPASRITVREIQQHPWVSLMRTVGSPRPMRSREAAVPETTAKKPARPCKSKRHCHRTRFSDSSLSGASDLAMSNDSILMSSHLPAASESSLQTLSLDQLLSLENADQPDQLMHHRRRRFSLQSVFQRKRTISSTKVPFRD